MIIFALPLVAFSMNVSASTGDMVTSERLNALISEGTWNGTIISHVTTKVEGSLVQVITQETEHSVCVTKMSMPSGSSVKFHDSKRCKLDLTESARLPLCDGVTPDSISYHLQSSKDVGGVGDTEITFEYFENSESVLEGVLSSDGDLNILHSKCDS